jgi:hypothetical protein
MANKDPFATVKPYRDPISNTVLKNPSPYPAGRGIIRPASPSIDKKITAEQRRNAKPSR